MSKQPILIVMAAGLGSRFGGIKQLASLNEHQDSIIDYSLFDAFQAGFRRVIFIVNEKIKNDFYNRIGQRAEMHFETHYIIQRFDSLPDGFSVPDGRVKPWGTGHAVLSCAAIADAPFAVINGDDFYGAEAFRKIYFFLSSVKSDNDYAMVGFSLKNTLSEFGAVSRGICHISRNETLESITELTHIISTSDGPMYTEDGLHYTLLNPETPVSMNMWGFPLRFMEKLEQDFLVFCRESMHSDPLKAEFFLPSAVNNALKEGTASVHFLHTADKWYGITFHEDLPQVKAAIDSMTRNGIYPRLLWK